ncbi:hypothetical protein DH2020_039930 [Rehmannia glutinosa]|uniref:Myb/SANT-like DNA-binding domain-containing protein n=1 Tax=Rehmannia glutinosa TaxID=99300 RepID=A0ABR0UV79_REHGL
MASCDEDFSLLDDHQNPNSAQPSTATTTQTPPYQISPYDHDSDPFDSEPDPNSISGKRLIDRDDIHSGTSKRTRLPSSGGSGDYRKDREEWSDTAIACLLEAYSEKFLQLSRGNLRGRDWEEVAAMVSERCENQTKSVEQCKNKVDNLKKRYKLERHRLSNGNVAVSNWPWFKQMEQIVGNSLAARAAAEDEKSSGGGGASFSNRQSKRLGIGTTPNSPGGQINNIKSKPSNNLRWRRVVFKISGATLAGSAPNNIDPKVAMLIAREVSIACHVGVEVAIVVGGRNFFCGDAWVTSTGLDRCTAYQIGLRTDMMKIGSRGVTPNDIPIVTRMMATVMNSILLQSALEKLGVQTRVQSAFSMPEVAEPYSRQRAIRHLEKGRVYSSRAYFLQGVGFPGAPPMDMMAVTFCEENGIPVGIFNLHEPGNISRALCGERVGTLIDQTGSVT